MARIKKTEEEKKAEIEAKIFKMTGIDFQQLINEHATMLYYLHSMVGNLDYWEDEPSPWAKSLIKELKYDFSGSDGFHYWDEYNSQCPKCESYHTRIIRLGEDWKFMLICEECKYHGETSIDDEDETEVEKVVEKKVELKVVK